jgi:hypothetical protein
VRTKDKPRNWYLLSTGRLISSSYGELQCHDCETPKRMHEQAAIYIGSKDEQLRLCDDCATKRGFKW